MEKDIKNKGLIVKFLAGEISDNEIYLLKKWLDKEPANRKIFDEENELWQKTGIKTSVDHYKTDEIWSKISKDLGIGKNRINKVVILKKNYFRISIVAASIAFLVAIGGLSLLLMERGSSRKIAVPSSLVKTDDGERTHIFLADSTEVILNSGSTLEYTSDYNINDRVVKLTGEGFFDVRTNSDKPFLVQVDKLTISATGTRFNVFSYKNEDRIETTLEEGKIHVQVSEKEKYDLAQGQQIVYFVRTAKAIVRHVNTETYTSWKENKLRFIDTPFEEVLRKIARKYNVTFEIKNRELLELKYTATFIDESIEDVMKLLKKVSPITYQIHNFTTINDKQYLKPKIIVEKRKTSS